MNFAADAVVDAIAPSPVRPTARAQNDDTPSASFDEHLAQSEQTAPPTPAYAKESAPEASAPETPQPIAAALIGAPPPAPIPAAAPVLLQVIAAAPAMQAEPADGAPPQPPAHTPPPTPNVPSAPAAPSTQAATSAPPATQHTPITTQAPTAAPNPAAQQPAPTQIANAETPQQPQAPNQPSAQAQTAATPITPTLTPIAAQPQTPPPIPAVAAPTAPSAPTPRTAHAAEAKPAPESGKNTSAPSNTGLANAKGTQIKGAAPTAQPIDFSAFALRDGADTAQQTQPTSPAALTTQSAAHAQQASATEQNVARAAPAAAQVSREIIRRFDGGSTRFELRLDPPELGRVEVRLEVTRDHRVTALISADNPQALAELARHARDLEQSLQSAGLELGDDGLSFDLRQGDDDTSEAAGDSARTGGANGEPNGEDNQIAPQQTARLERWRGMRIDVMA